MKTQTNKPASTTVRCGMCGSRDLRASYPRWWDYLVARLRHFEVLRCRACRHRSRVYFGDSVTA